MIKQLLSFKSIVSLDLPQIFLLVEVTIITLLLHLTSGNIWDSLQIMLCEQVFCLLLIRVIDHTEEGGHGKFVFMLLVRVCCPNELVLDIPTFVAT